MASDVLDVRAFVVIADAEDVIANPGLLAAFAAVFGPDDDATLLLAAPELDILPGAFSAAADGVGLDDRTLPDVLALPLGGLADVSSAIATRMAAVLSTVRPGGELADLPWIGAADGERMRTLSAWCAARAEMAARLPSRFALPEGYRSHAAPAYFDDTHRSHTDTVHQPHVYEAAAAIARRTGATHIVDIGCGAGDKLVALAPEFELVGIDFGPNLEHCRRTYAEHTWLDWNIEHEAVPELSSEVLERSVVICADVIEHLVDPTGLLLGLARFAEHAQAILISTPDRARVRGPRDPGPSPNPAHVREWTLAELTALLQDAGSPPAFAGHTINNDRYRLKRTSLAIVDRRRSWSGCLPPDDFQVVARVPEKPTAAVAERLRDDGLQIEVAQAPQPDPDADWIVELGHGEILESPWPGTSVREALYGAQQAGYDSVDAIAIEHAAHDGRCRDDFFRFAPVAERVKVAARPGVASHRVFPYDFLARQTSCAAVTHEQQALRRDNDFADDYLVERLTGVGALSDQVAGRRAMRALTRPRVVMTLLVRDEIDVIRANLEHHFAHGVDFVIATDHLSQDGTTEVLEEYAAAGRLQLIRETAPSYDQEHWVTRMARLAADEHGADWVLNVDADEFWWTDSHDLAETLGRLPGRVDRAITWRHNFVPRPEDGTHFLQRMRWRSTRSVTWEGKPMGPKVCHRASHDVLVPMGNHDAHGLPGAYTDDSQIRVLHFPWRTQAQVTAKVVNGTHAIELRPELNDQVVSHWRSLAAQHRDGGLDTAWQEMCVDDETLHTMLATGAVVEDLRLRDALGQLVGASRTYRPGYA